MDLFRHELYKILHRKTLWVLTGILLILMSLSLAYQVYYSHGNLDAHKSFAPYEGTVTDAKVKENDAVNALTLKKHPENIGLTSDEYDEEYVATALMQTQYAQQSYTEQMQNAIHHNATASDGYEQKEAKLQIAALNQVGPPEMHYARAWNYMASFYQVIGSLLVAIMVFLGLSSVFSNENATGVGNFILSSKHGRRKVVTAKLLAAAAYVGLAALILAGCNFIENVSLFGFYGWNTRLRDLSDYMSTPYALSAWKYALIQFSLYLFGSLAFSTLVLYLSARTRSTIVSLVVSALLYALPFLVLGVFHFNVRYLTTLMSLTYPPVIGSASLFSSFTVHNVFGTPVSSLTLALWAMAVSSLVFVCLTYRAVRTEQIAA